MDWGKQAEVESLVKEGETTLAGEQLPAEMGRVGVGIEEINGYQAKVRNPGPGKAFMQHCANSLCEKC